ncbi:beta-hexosaminidase [Apiospora arundinis]
MYRCLRARAAGEVGDCANLRLSWRAISIANSSRRCLRYSACQPRRGFSVIPARYASPLGKPQLVSDILPPIREVQHGSGDRPGPSRYPRFPLRLWRPDFKAASQALEWICTPLKMPIHFDWQSSTTDDRQHSVSLRVKMGFKILGEATAVAETWAHARSDAMVQIVKSFEGTGFLSDLHMALEKCQIHVPDCIMPSQDDMISALASAQSDIYNLSARLGFAPQFEFVKHTVRHSLINRPSFVTKAAISIPELEINVSTTHTIAGTAGFAACILFKAQIEQKIREGILTAQSTLLTVDTASDFLRLFGQTLRRPVVFKLSHEYNHRDIHGIINTAIQMGDSVFPVNILTMSRREIQKFAQLVLAVQLIKDNPALIPLVQPPFLIAGKKKAKPISPIPLELGAGVLGVMRRVTKQVWSRELRSNGDRAMPTSTEYDEGLFNRSRLADGPQKEVLNEAMQQRLRAFKIAPEFEDMRQSQASLPMSHQRKQVLSLIQDAQTPFSLVVGATGSGKTTQVPQFLLDDAIERGVGADCNIICTQPRRIAATSVAARVAVERGEQLGESVGYHVRFDATRPRPHGSITYCTTGLLLEQFKAGADGVLSYASHIIIDEAHERDLPIDFLMAMLKKAVEARQARDLPVPKVVLMSATLDSELFANYFGSPCGEGSALVPAPSISVPGRTFSVQARYLDEIMSDLMIQQQTKTDQLLHDDERLSRYLKHELYAMEGPSNDDWGEEQQEDFVPVALVAVTIAHICKTTQEGAILVFLPGLKEILHTEKELIYNDKIQVGFGNKTRYCIHILHSWMPRQDQAVVFEKPPRGCRKIILSTNIAETSVTVPDVQYVVDAGKLREMRYDQLTRISGLRCVWESKSNARQRAGRAGRVQDGFYYALFSRDRHAQMAAAGIPEVLRSDLQETCLAIKKQLPQESVSEVLAGFIEPPSGVAVIGALQHLKRLKALTDEEKFTPLGHLLASLPVHPTLGKMVIMGVIFRCLDPLIILAAAEAATPLFIVPVESKLAAYESHKSFGGYASDHIAVVQAFSELRTLNNEFSDQAARGIAGDMFLSWDAFCAIRRNAQSILSNLVESGIVPSTAQDDPRSDFQYGPSWMNVNSKNKELVRGLLVAGLYPNLAVNQTGRGAFVSRDVRSLLIHPASENSTLKSRRLASKHRRALQPDSAVPTALVAFSQVHRVVAGGGEQLSLRETSVIHPLTAVLFADDRALVSTNAHDGAVTISPGGWLPFQVQSSGATNTTATTTEDVRGGDSVGDLGMLLEFKSLLDTMLDRVYRDMALRQRAQTSWAFSPSGPALSKTNDLLRQAMVEAVLQVLDNMQTPVSGRGAATSAAAADAAVANLQEIVTDRAPRRGSRPFIQIKTPDSHQVAQSAES